MLTVGRGMHFSVGARKPQVQESAHISDSWHCFIFVHTFFFVEGAFW